MVFKSPTANPVWNRKNPMMGPVNLHMELHNQINNAIIWYFKVPLKIPPLLFKELEKEKSHTSSIVCM